jgi:tape measure domain-containing protein
MANARAIEAARAFIRIYADDTQLRATLAGLKGQLQRTSEAFSGIATNATIAGIGAAAAGIVTVGANAERTAVAFEVMLGSADRAKQMLDEIYALGANSPFGAAEFMQAGQVLLNFGASADSVLPTLSMLGDIAAGDSEKLQRMTMVYGQMTAAGRLMGQDLLQMINAGFNPLQQISEATGESMLELKKRMEAGGISSNEVAEAFKAATSEGGRFYGMTSRISKTTIGVWMTLKDEIMMLAKNMSSYLLPAVNMALSGVSWMVSLFTRWGKGIVYSAVALGTFLTVMKSLTLAQIAYTKAAVVAQAFTGPKGWAMLALGAVAAAAAVAAIDLSTDSLRQSAEAAHPPLDTMSKDAAKLAQTVPQATTALRDMEAAAANAKRGLDRLKTPAQQAADSTAEFAANLAAAGEFGMILEGNPLVEAFMNYESGYTDSLRQIQEEIRILSGVATEASIELENMAAAGVNPEQIEQLRQLQEQRDQLLQAEDNKKYWAERQQEMEQAAEAVKASIRTVEDQFALERQRLDQLVSANLITQADADAALRKNPQFAAIMDGVNPNAIASATAANTPAQDLRSVAGASQLTSLFNNQQSVADKSLEVQRQTREYLKRLKELAEQGEPSVKV